MKHSWSLKSSTDTPPSHHLWTVPNVVIPCYANSHTVISRHLGNMFYIIWQVPVCSLMLYIDISSVAVINVPSLLLSISVHSSDRILLLLKLEYKHYLHIKAQGWTTWNGRDSVLVFEHDLTIWGIQTIVQNWHVFGLQVNWLKTFIVRDSDFVTLLWMIQIYTWVAWKF